MLVVKDPGQELPLSKNKDEAFQWPHGLSTPLKYVRKRRFRKRMSKKGIEDVEREVERLIAADIQSLDVQYDLYDQKEYEESYRAEEDADIDENQPENGADIDELDLDFAAELEEALDAEDFEGLSDDSTDEEQEQGESDDEAEKNPADQQKAIIEEEIRDLEAKIVEKKQTMEQQTNVIMKKRMEEIIKSLNNELNIKKKQLKDV
jgi:transcription initiation factor TFIID subunit 7